MTALFLLSLLAADLEAHAQVVSETAAGSAPLVPGQQPRAGMSTRLQPALSLRLVERALTLRAQYSPRLYWRYPNIQASARPLVLHNAELGAEAALSSRTRLGALGMASVGEADYNALPALLGEGQGALPARLELLTINADASLTHELTSRWQASGGVGFTHFRSLNEGPAADPGAPAPVSDPLFARLYSYSANLGANHRATRRDQLTASFSGTHHVQSGGLDLWSWQPRLGWNRRMDNRQSLQLSAGAAYVRQSGSPLIEARSYVSPLAQVGHSALIHRWGNVALSSSAGATIEHHVDPVLGNAGARSVASTGWSLLVAPAWSFQANAMFGTSLRSDPLPGEPDETMFSASVAARHRSNDHLVFEGGIRWSDRGPHLQAANFDLHQRDAWVYVSMTLTTLAAGNNAPP